MSNKTYRSLVLFGILALSARSALADSVYLSLNLEEDVTDGIYQSLDHTDFFANRPKAPFHISVVDMNVNSAQAENVIAFIEKEVTQILKSKIDKPMYIDTDQVALIGTDRAQQNQGNGFVVLESKSLKGAVANIEDKNRTTYLNEKLNHCNESKLKTNSLNQVAKAIAKSLQGTGQDGFTQVAFKKSVQKAELSPTFPHVTLEKLPRAKDDEFNRLETWEKTNAPAFAEALLPDANTCERIRFHVTGYYLHWIKNGQQLTKNVRFNHFDSDSRKPLKLKPPRNQKVLDKK